MRIVPVNTPTVVKKFLSNYIWEVPSTEKVLYLTFDDGPTPEITNWTLKTLNEHNAKATFFCIGKNIENHPDIFKSILDKGHAVGNHTHNHIKGWQTGTADYLDNVSKAESVIQDRIKNQKSTISNKQSVVPKLFRPPYGQIKPKQGKALLDLNYKIIMWNVLSFDWDKNVKPETCLNNVTTKSKPGSIIVFHDSLKASKNLIFALPKVLKYFGEKGYTFKALNT
ncbi:polysaccharide deacetylase family protein [Hanstruepera marina]|uniref:polysaccharide deacetylase family protein n=1 Tax=Hanstruepera marina TaxID=2873265 RepID=UPI001CA6B138|nr:polysaccharide deacetylase family protein [Hanstruepera marina]